MKGEAPIPDTAIERHKICPLLLRCFCREGGHNSADDYAPGAEQLPKNELDIYTWMDATLRELTTLIQDVNPSARRAGARLSFALVYPTKQGRMVLKEVGTVAAQQPDGSGSGDDNKSLKGLRFQTGDYLDVAIV